MSVAADGTFVIRTARQQVQWDPVQVIGIGAVGGDVSVGLATVTFTFNDGNLYALANVGAKVNVAGARTFSMEVLTTDGPAGNQERFGDWRAAGSATMAPLANFTLPRAFLPINFVQVATDNPAAGNTFSASIRLWRFTSDILRQYRYTDLLPFLPSS